MRDEAPRAAWAAAAAAQEARAPGKAAPRAVARQRPRRGTCGRRGGGRGPARRRREPAGRGPPAWLPAPHGWSPVSMSSGPIIQRARHVLVKDLQHDVAQADVVAFAERGALHLLVVDEDAVGAAGVADGDPRGPASSTAWRREHFESFRTSSHDGSRPRTATVPEARRRAARPLDIGPRTSSHSPPEDVECRSGSRGF
jgi:hypothetical protein